MAELKEKLFSEFAPVSTEEWMAKITADLKGVPFEKSGRGWDDLPACSIIALSVFFAL